MQKLQAKVCINKRRYGICMYISQRGVNLACAMFKEEVKQVNTHAERAEIARCFQARERQRAAELKSYLNKKAGLKTALKTRFHRAVREAENDREYQIAPKEWVVWSEIAQSYQMPSGKYYTSDINNAPRHTFSEAKARMLKKPSHLRIHTLTQPKVSTYYA